MDGFEHVRAVATCVRVVHHLRGRIRLKLAETGPELPRPSETQVRHLHRVIEAAEGVRSIRLNLLARSCTVEYDPAVIPMDAWTDFLAGTGSEAAGILEDILRAKYREIVHAQLR
ncbi:heavy-metal-associated domain-containing protein [Pseudothauera rhizosphaerae]|uniref:Heavy-metal-associated domain-containing protein n=1 Tax=Pseudothauera rhizosphaerae TaxID=2565932 RepID=A0A4S4AXC8_9RHOO|nr:heavy metal-associated domain-containing protein [Pseudothauera rhizosphaerae]THF63262.1 heavy-metal-associated domain-containing protein [Pseudothauera rhizosphaerae]